MEQSPQYVIEMLHITKEFPGIKANDDITLQLRKGEIHALLGENGAGKSTLMSVLFGLYQPEEGEIRKNGKPVKINDPNDATALGIGMVHQHFKLIDVFTVLDNIILGAEDTKLGFLQKKEARRGGPLQNGCPNTLTLPFKEIQISAAQFLRVFEIPGRSPKLQKQANGTARILHCAASGPLSFISYTVTP